MELHPLCTLFPRIEGDEFQVLVEDIKQHGLRSPIVLCEGSILDGQNRYFACLEAGVEPRYVTFDSDYDGDIVAFVLSVNLHRRHMSAGQQATIVAAAQDWSKAKTVGKPNSAKLQNITAADRAATSGASIRTQSTADKLVRTNPELAQAVAQGKISLGKAIAQIMPDKPALKVVEPELEPEDEEYTELDAERDRNADLLQELAVAKSAPADKETVDRLISELRNENKALEAELKAVKASRDSFQMENSELKKQIHRQRKEIDKVTGKKTA